MAFSAIASVFLIAFIWLFAQLPSQKDLKSCFTTKMYEVKLCPGSPTYAKFSEISHYLPDAVVMSEDGKFYSHHGFDFDELKRSLEKNMAKGFYARGGSTITQQLAKNLYLTKEKTLTRKAREALITLQLEKYLTKKEILEKYLNVVQFGKNIFGVKAASQFYFQKTPAQLNLLESVFLAFLLPNPEKYAQSYNRKELTPFARGRLNEIVDRLHQVAKINDHEYSSTKEAIASLFRPVPEQPNEGVPDEDSTDEDGNDSEREPNSVIENSNDDLTHVEIPDSGAAGEQPESEDSSDQAAVHSSP